MALQFKRFKQCSDIEGPLKTFCKNTNRSLVPRVSSPQYSGWKTTNFKIKLIKIKKVMLIRQFKNIIFVF